MVEAKRIARREGRVVEGNRIEEWITVSVCVFFESCFVERARVDITCGCSVCACVTWDGVGFDWADRGGADDKTGQDSISY